MHITILSIFHFCSPNASSFERFQLSVRKQEMYRENDPLIDELLHDLATWPIESVGRHPSIWIIV